MKGFIEGKLKNQPFATLKKKPQEFEFSYSLKRQSWLVRAVFQNPFQCFYFFEKQVRYFIHLFFLVCAKVFDFLIIFKTKSFCFTPIELSILDRREKDFSPFPVFFELTFLFHFFERDSKLLKKVTRVKERRFIWREIIDRKMANL